MFSHMHSSNGALLSMFVPIPNHRKKALSDGNNYVSGAMISVLLEIPENMLVVTIMWNCVGCSCRERHALPYSNFCSLCTSSRLMLWDGRMQYQYYSPVKTASSRASAFVPLLLDEPMQLLSRFVGFLIKSFEGSNGALQICCIMSLHSGRNQVTILNSSQITQQSPSWLW